VFGIQIEAGAGCGPTERSTSAHRSTRCFEGFGIPERAPAGVAALANGLGVEGGTLCEGTGIERQLVTCPAGHFNATLPGETLHSRVCRQAFVSSA